MQIPDLCLVQTAPYLHRCGKPPHAKPRILQQCRVSSNFCVPDCKVGWAESSILWSLWWKSRQMLQPWRAELLTCTLFTTISMSRKTCRWLICWSFQDYDTKFSQKETHRDKFWTKNMYFPSICNYLISKNMDTNQAVHFCEQVLWRVGKKNFAEQSKLFR